MTIEPNPSAPLRPDGTDGPDRIVIVGAGHGGANAAAFLRQFGHTGPIVIIGDEPVAPYQRPPLSKAYLLGETGADALRIRPDAFYRDKQITLRLATRVVRVDREARRLLLADGSAERYDRLILATGSRARRLMPPEGALDGVHVLRSLADAGAIRDALRPGARLVVIGGGYVGLEAAASARALGMQVTLVEREPRLLARVACAPLAAFFADAHRAHGVEIIAPAAVAALEDEAGVVRAVRLSDGRRLDCDAVLVGIGGEPCDELAVAAGLACDGGVIVDGEARTSDPAIYAIGDVTRRPLAGAGDRLARIESVPNAVEQARRAAADLLGAPQLAHETPWFWSDQYDLKLQIAGIPSGASELVIRGDRTAGRFAVWHMGGDRVLAVEAVNMPAEFMAGRKLVGHVVDRARLADPDTPAKALAAAQAAPSTA